MEKKEFTMAMPAINGGEVSLPFGAILGALRGSARNAQTNRLLMLLSEVAFFQMIAICPKILDILFL